MKNNFLNTIVALFLSLSSLQLFAAEVNITGSSSDDFVIAAKYGYRTQALSCKGINILGLYNQYEEDVHYANQFEDNTYSLLLSPEQIREPGFCEWTLVSLNLLIQPKEKVEGQRVQDAVLVVRSSSYDSSFVNELPNVADFMDLSCEVKKYDELVGYEELTHYVECKAGNGSNIKFTQTILDVDRDQDLTLDFNL